MVRSLKTRSVQLKKIGDHFETTEASPQVKLSAQETEEKNNLLDALQKVFELLFLSSI